MRQVFTHSELLCAMSPRTLLNRNLGIYAAPGHKVGGGPLPQGCAVGAGWRWGLLRVRSRFARIWTRSGELGPPVPSPIVVQLLLRCSSLLQQRGSRARDGSSLLLGSLFRTKSVAHSTASEKQRQRGQ